MASQFQGRADAAARELNQPAASEAEADNAQKQVSAAFSEEIRRTLGREPTTAEVEEFVDKTLTTDFFRRFINREITTGDITGFAKSAISNIQEVEQEQVGQQGQGERDRIVSEENLAREAALEKRIDTIFGRAGEFQAERAGEAITEQRAGTRGSLLEEQAALGTLRSGVGRGGREEFDVETADLRQRTLEGIFGRLAGQRAQGLAGLAAQGAVLAGRERRAGEQVGQFGQELGFRKRGQRLGFAFQEKQLAAQRAEASLDRLFGGREAERERKFKKDIFQEQQPGPFERVAQVAGTAKDITGSVLDVKKIRGG